MTPAKPTESVSLQGDKAPVAIVDALKGGGKWGIEVAKELKRPGSRRMEFGAMSECGCCVAGELLGGLRTELLWRVCGLLPSWLDGD